MKTLKALLSIGIAMCSIIASAQSNQAFQQKTYFASDYGTWQIKGQSANNYQFSPPAVCQISPPSETKPFIPFATNAPVLILDAQASNTEVVTPTSVVNNSGYCGIIAQPIHPHYSFSLLSATGGLQEVLNQIPSSIPYATQVILDRNWYTAVNSVPGQTAAAVIASVKGNTSAYLLDATQAPNVFYVWSGSAYVAQASGGGSPTGNAGGTLAGTYPNPSLGTVNVSQISGAAPIASPTFTGTPLAPTKPISDNNTEIATTQAVTAAGYAPLASPGFSGTPTAPTVAVATNNTQIATTSAVTSALIGYAPLTNAPLTGIPTAPTAANGTNTNQLATTAFVLANSSSGGITPATQFKLPAYAPGGLTIAGTSITTDTTGNNLNIPAGALTLSNPGVFGTGSSIFTYNTTTVGGCNPSSDYHSVQFSFNMTAGLTVCNSNTTGSGSNLPVGIFASSTEGVPGIDANAGSFYGFTTVNSGRVIAINPVAQDILGLTSGVSLSTSEFDTQPTNPPSAYSNVGGISIYMYNEHANSGTYPGSALLFHVTNTAGGTAYWNTGINFDTGSLGPISTTINVGSMAAATSGANSNCPPLLHAYEQYWNGSASVNEGWTLNCSIGSGTNPANDSLVLGHAAGTVPSGQKHWLELAGVNGTTGLQLDGSSSGFAQLSASATGSAMTVTAPGGITLPAATVVAPANGDNSTSVPSTAWANANLLFTGGGINSTQATQTPTTFPAVGSVFQVDGFSSGTYRGAWSSATAYNRYDTVTSGGVDWIAVNGSTNVTPAAGAAGAAQFWMQFDTTGAGLAATQADAAFAWAWGQVQLHATGFGAYSSVGLVFGNKLGGYPKNGDWIFPTNTVGYTISLFGQGRGQTRIYQTASTLNYMVSSPNVTSSGGQTIQGITLDANLLAGGCLSHHLRRSVVSDVACWNPQQQASGTIASAMWLGQGADSYESMYQHLLVRGPTYSGLVAAYGTATVTAGAITSITWGGTGTNLNLPVTAGPGLVAYFLGKGASGASYQPCGTMPVVSAIALTGGSINTGTGVGGFTFSNAGVTCGGTIYVRVQQAGTIGEAYLLGGADTTVDDIVTSGDFTTTCEYVNGPFSLTHEHPYCAAPYQIESFGNGVRNHIAPEMDSPIQYGMYISGSGATITGGFAEYNAANEYGAGDYLVDASATNFSIASSGCYSGAVQSFGGYAKFTGTTIGSMTPNSAWPVSASISGVQEQCDGSAALWGIYPVAGSASTVPTAYSGSVTYPAGAIAYDGSGNNYSSLSAGNVGNALSNATFWHFLGGVSSTITGGNCVTAGQVVTGISTAGVPTCAGPITPLIVNNPSANITTGTTIYYPPTGYMNFNTSESTREVAYPRSGTIGNLTVCFPNATGSGGTIVITYRQATGYPGTPAGTALTLTLAASTAGGCYSGGTSFAYTAGNGIDIQVVNNSGSNFAPNQIYAELVGPN